MQTLGERIKEIRLHLGIDQDEMAKRVDCHHTYVYKIEKGSYQDLRISTLVRFARALGVSTEALLKGTEHETSTAGDVQLLLNDLDDIEDHVFSTRTATGKAKKQKDDD